METSLINNFNAQTHLDVIGIGPHYQVDVNDPVNITAERAASFRHILETGEVPIVRGDSQRDFGTPSIHVDWQSDDAYTRAVQSIHDNTLARIEADPTLTELLAKPEWDRNDRMQWENSLSTIVSEETDKVPGLDRYRTTIDPEFPDDASNPAVQDPQKAAQEATLRINDLSSDIESGSGRYEYDCDIMAVTEGSVMQRIEDSVLPQTPDAPDSMKYAAPYYLGSGQLSSIDPEAMEATSGYHAFIVSSATGSIIEATSDPSEGQTPYMEAESHYDFQDFASGAPFIDADSVVYATYPMRYGSYAPDAVRGMVDELKSNMDSRLQDLKGATQGLENDPSFAAAAEIIRVQNEYGQISPDMKDTLDELLDDEIMSAPLDDLRRITGDLAGYGNLISKMNVLAVENNIFTPAEGQANLKYLEGMAAETGAAVSSIPSGTYSLEADTKPMVETMGWGVEESFDAPLTGLRSAVASATPLPQFENDLNSGGSTFTVPTR